MVNRARSLYRSACAILALTLMITPLSSGSANSPAAIIQSDHKNSLDLPLAPGDEFWEDDFVLNGPDGPVRALANDGQGGLYVGGSFTTIGKQQMNGIARWDLSSSTWSPLVDGGGITGISGQVMALAWDGNSLYVAGQFTQAGGLAAANIARWTPPATLGGAGTWSTLGSGLDSTVHALAWSGSKLYAGGEFTQAGSAPARHIAFWESGAWSALAGTGCAGNDGVDDFVLSLAWDGTSGLYAGGSFLNTCAGGAQHVAKWNGAAWETLGAGVDGTVKALAYSTSLSRLVVGGDFANAGGLASPYLAYYSAGVWTQIADTPNGAVTALWPAPSGGLYVAGSFTLVGIKYAARVAYLNGVYLQALGDGITHASGEISALVLDSNNNLFAGGDFDLVGNTPAVNLAVYYPATTRWQPVGGQRNGAIDGEVRAIARDGLGGVYLAGDFSVAGSTAANNIVYWQPGEKAGAWKPLGFGLDGPVDSLVWDPNYNTLYVGGEFTHAGNTSYAEILVNHVANWDPKTTRWSVLGTTGNPGVNGNVYALAWNGFLYVGGSFITDDSGVTLNGVAKYNPFDYSWTTLGRGIGGSQGVVYSLAVGGGWIYAGGSFTSTLNSGGIEVLANNVARWDTSNLQWSALISNTVNGTNGPVYALAYDGNTGSHNKFSVYVGGSFDQAGGVSAGAVALWKCELVNPKNCQWNTLGPGLFKNGGTAEANAISITNNPDAMMCTGGSFDQAGDAPAANLACWTPAVDAWNAVGSGTNGPILALQSINSNSLWLGGAFHLAGGQASDRFAHWQRPIYVDQNATGADDGKSWESAFTDLAPAMAKLAADDELWVAKGTYTPTSTLTARQVSFILNDQVNVFGGFSGSETDRDQRDWAANETILSGDIQNDGINTNNSYHVVKTFKTLTTGGVSSILDGFTITGGYADGANPNNLGGGLYANGSGSGDAYPVLRHLIFKNNTAQGGGGAYLNSLYPSLSNSSFYNNSAISGSAGTGYGGGLWIENTDALISNLTLYGNSAAAKGGGLYVALRFVTLSNSILWNNTATLASATESQYYSLSARLSLDRAIIQNGCVDTEDIDCYFVSDANPSFMDAANGDLRLLSNSPAIDAGSNSSVPNGLYTDLASRPRFIDYPVSDPTSAMGIPPIVDIGAYEISNIAPVLDNSGTPAFDDISPLGTNKGNSVSELISRLGGTKITDMDPGALQGIAITDIDNTKGAWQFSTDYGNGWTDLDMVSDTSATLLYADASTRIRFLANFSQGSVIVSSITFRAWDRSDNWPNGMTSVNTAINGGTTPYSTATETASITFSGNRSPVLQPISSQTVLVSTLLTFTAQASDPDTGQTLTYSIAGKTPPGANINASSGVFSWSPRLPGQYQITIRVTDNGNPILYDEEVFTVTVTGQAIFLPNVIKIK